ncbi:uncharacterized protein LOC129775513 isoform X2 [Toxorhynchites rutilus septentrionalis]|uniref:uncharacterized protein LOC129775513 isoform X2 n=1 Tax=Toxorhynchites rutilus septentrionalis TaxID=329112 RepID=UPI0024787656|nr:uncharacterized protein LOC129775513 isoform X2 [Toxorhynchites rutilus septentrionalis]
MRILDKLRLPALGITGVPTGALTLLGTMLLCTSLSVVQTGPVIRSRRMMREIYGEITDASAQNVTNFVDTCLYDGSQVSRTSIVCEKKHGCRAIQKTGECCPDYQCECQRDGKTYANGEKVFDPETPCRVCYCQGGEISCSQVTCYKRHDCEPKFISGRCCPEYDNCPPLENSKLAETVSPKEESSAESKETGLDAEDLLEFDQPKAIPVSSSSAAPISTTTTTTTTTVTTESPTSAKIVIPAASNNPLGIKIKEITKGEEIRLTDSRPKISTTTSISTSSSEEAARPSTESSASHSEEANNLEHLDLNITDDGEDGIKNVRHTDEDAGASGSAEVRSTAAPPASEEVEVSSEASTQTIRILSASSTAMPDDASDEVTKKDKPLPAVVQIGDKLVIVDHNQPKPITVIQVEEVEGLQRGEDDISYDQEMYTDRAPDSRDTPKHMKLDSGEGEMLSTQADSSAAYETIYRGGGSADNGAYETVYRGGSTEHMAAFETVYRGGSTDNVASEEAFETQHYTEAPKEVQERHEMQADQMSASSEEFIQIASSSEQSVRLVEEHTTVNSLVTSGEEGSTTADFHMSAAASSEASGDEVFDTHFYTEGPGGSSETTDVVTNALSESQEPSKPGKDMSGDDMTTHSKPYIEDDEHDLIQPGFQPIPEDFSLPLQDQPTMMDMADELDQHSSSMKSERRDDGGEASKILSEVLEYRKNKTTTTTEASTSEVDTAATNSPAWLKEPLKPELRSPGEPLLIPEWERRHNRTGNSSSFEEESSGAGEFHILKMNSEEYIDRSEGSELSSSTRKESEETTLTPSKILQQDIDSPDSGSSLESDSIKHNPKNDVESVKYDENENSAVEDVLPKQVQSSI